MGQIISVQFSYSSRADKTDGNFPFHTIFFLIIRRLIALYFTGQFRPPDDDYTGTF
jgi:hypothetical protein